MGEIKKIKLIDTLPKPEPEQTFAQEIQEDAVMGLIEGFLPKIKPMIEKAITKLDEYFGDDSKIFLIRRQAGQAAKVIVLSNVKGYYEISNKTSIEGEGDDAEVLMEKEFKVHKDAVIDVYDTADFISKLLNGEFTKPK